MKGKHSQERDALNLRRKELDLEHAKIANDKANRRLEYTQMLLSINPELGEVIYKVSEFAGAFVGALLDKQTPELTTNEPRFIETRNNKAVYNHSEVNKVSKAFETEQRNHYLPEAMNLKDAANAIIKATMHGIETGVMPTLIFTLRDQLNAALPPELPQEAPPKQKDWPREACLYPLWTNPVELNRLKTIVTENMAQSVAICIYVANHYINNGDTNHAVKFAEDLEKMFSFDVQKETLSVLPENLSHGVIAARLFEYLQTHHTNAEGLLKISLPNNEHLYRYAQELAEAATTENPYNPLVGEKTELRENTTTVCGFLAGFDVCHVPGCLHKENAPGYKCPTCEKVTYGAQPTECVFCATPFN